MTTENARRANQQKAARLIERDPDYYRKLSALGLEARRKPQAGVLRTFEADAGIPPKILEKWDATMKRWLG